MSTTNSVANGARLDDCHTSIFSLADLTGLRWKKFTSTLSMSVLPSDDPILEAFSKCLAQDILAVWRKAPNPKKYTSSHMQISQYQQEDDINSSLNSNLELKKELWIFWWGNESSVEDMGRMDGLISEPENSWEDQGLSYECRTLLFKAIHNLVERCLLTDNFIRIGKWFLRPYCKDEDKDKSERLSCSFTFFLRGELTVCTTVEIAHHQVVETINEQHLQQASTLHIPMDVILSPYGLRASLTGVSYKSRHEPRVKKVIEEWRQFYPLHLANENSDFEEYDETVHYVPPVVEVVVAAVRMNYPSAYVFCPVNENVPKTGNLDAVNSNESGSQFQQTATASDGYNLNSINSSMGEVAPASTYESSENGVLAREKSKPLERASSGVAVSLITRVVNQSHSVSSLPSSNNTMEVQKTTPSSVQDSNVNVPASPENVMHEKSSCWSHLINPFKKVRQKSNFQPKNEDYNLENQMQTEARRKMDKHKQSNNAPFHHNSVATSLSASQTSLNPCFQPTQMRNDYKFMNYGQGAPPYSNLDPYFLNSLEITVGQTSCDIYPPNGEVNRPTQNVVPNDSSNANTERTFKLQNNAVSLKTSLMCQEIKQPIPHWKRLKLPPSKEDKPVHKAGNSLDAKPSVVPDSLDAQCGISPTALRLLRHMKSSISDIRKDWSWSAISSKRRKIEEEKFVNEETDALLTRASFSDDARNDTQRIVTQHVTVGSVPGELAGIPVPSDPYDFEEEDKDNSSIMSLNPSLTADINLKVNLWSNENSVSGMTSKDCFAPESSHLESLLRHDDNSPLTSHAEPVQLSAQSAGMDEIAKLYTHSLTEQKDLKVSQYDLDHIFNESEDDDIGIPTPPTDHYADVSTQDFQQTSSANQNAKYDLFPTPPSLESQPFSPEGKILNTKPYVASAASVHKSHAEPCTNATYTTNGCNAAGSAGKMAGDALLTHGTTLPEELMASSTNIETKESHILTQRSEMILENQRHFGIYGTQHSSSQPLPENYLPVKNLASITNSDFDGKLPHQFLYVPSWQLQMESYLNHQNVMHVMDIEDQNYASVNNNILQSSMDAPSTGCYSSSVRTPASQTQPSPANFSTPAPRTPRENFMLTSPASSIATPATLGRTGTHQMTPLTSVSSSAAQSDIGICRASAIYVNLMLSDSVLNFFRDISFDQCTMCVCNESINSRDVDLGYLPSVAENLTEGQYSCQCGFSAVRNRCLSVDAGLFLEDELEIVGKELENKIIDSKQDNFKYSDENTESLVTYAMKQSSNPYFGDRYRNSSEVKYEVDNIVSRHDVMEACVEAINGGISVMDIGVQPKIKLHNCKHVFHQWTCTRALKSMNSADRYHMLQYLKPVLQDAIQRLRPDRSFNYIQRVNGPLTWREFCKDNSYALEPLPVPLLLVGQNHDWMTVSPFSLNYWEKLYLEPYAGTSNVSYVVICPDVEHIVSAAKSFFHETSSLYEQCRLGMHRPFLRNSKDNGIHRVGKNAMSSSDVPEWLKLLLKSGTWTQNNEGPTGNRSDFEVLECVQMYTAACSHVLDPLFCTTEPKQRQNSQSPTQNKPLSCGNLPMGKQGYVRPSTPLPAPVQMNLKIGRDAYSQSLLTFKNGTNDAGTIVIYFIDPFSSEHHSSLSLAIWNCYTRIVEWLPESLRSLVVIQLVPLKDLLQCIRLKNKSDVRIVRSLAFSTYSQCHRVVSHHMQVRTMTAFGPAASKKEAIQENIKRLAMSSINSPAFILANFKSMRKDLLNLEHKPEDCNILYLSYCISHNQKWLLASATNQDGEMLETFCISVEAPPRRLSVRRKQRVCVKSAAIMKLWNLCLGVITRTASVHWRIVVGRLGRLGHGEIQEWSKHLNRRNLSTLSKLVKSKCKQCSLNCSLMHPTILSACLTSMEPEGSFTIFPDLVKLAPFGRNTAGGTQLQLKTPEDASCTHIYVFPTSSSVQAAGGTFQNENMYFLPDELGFQMPELAEQDDLNLFAAVFEESPPPATNPQQSSDDMAGHVKPSTSDRLISNDGGNEETPLLQQPLALGYLVSTAPTGPLPDSFWVSCPHAKYHCPVFLRFALHIQVSSDEVQNVGTNDSPDDHHQLDSHKTAEVLRYVMENYNALSWLTCDPVSRDRRSCLPIHYLVLMRLYNTIKELT